MLSSEHNWFFFGALRSQVATEIEGGVSGVCRAIIKSFFGDLNSFNSGVVVRVGAESVVMIAFLHSIIGDETALKQVWSVKGSARHKCCFKCVSTISTPGDLASGMLVPAD